ALAWTFIGGEGAVGVECQGAVGGWGWPGVGGAPLVGPGQEVADGGAVERAGVAALEPVVEPGESLDVHAFPRPRQAVLAEHGHPYVRVAGESVPGFEQAGQVQGDVGPLSAEVDGDVDVGEQAGQVTVVPPTVPGGVLGGDCIEQSIPEVG